MKLTPDELSRVAATTVGHYNRTAEAFWQGTRDHDVSQNIAALLRHIEGAPPFTILDLGCGPGRDLKTFSEMGHVAIGLDGAQRFANLAREHSGCEVWEQDFLALRLPNGRFDGIFANVDKNTPKLRASLETYEAQVRQNAQATPLVRDVPLDVSLDDLRMGQWDAEEVRNLFTFLEFRTLWDRLLEAVGGPPAADAGPAETLDVDLERLATAEDAVATLQRLAGSIEPVAVGVAWSPWWPPRRRWPAPWGWPT